MYFSTLFVLIMGIQLMGKKLHEGNFHNYDFSVNYTASKYRDMKWDTYWRITR